MLVYNGRISLYSFLASQLVVILVPQINVIEKCVGSVWWIPPAYYLLLNTILFVFLRGFAYQVAVRAAFLGFSFSFGILMSTVAAASLKVFGWYICFLTFFHYTEFLIIAITNPKTLSLDSFILNHSKEYTIAAVASWLEFFIEWYFFPGLKQLTLLSAFGACLCIGGEALRKTAMLTAKTNFTHIVQNVHEKGHKLVTHGVYGYCRHPSYVGWFYWSVGTQLVLVNPICTIGYAVASWRFFHERILIEEVTLLNFFGEEYYQYQKKVPTGLPCIHGYRIEF